MASIVIYSHTHQWKLRSRNLINTVVSWHPRRTRDFAKEGELSLYTEYTKKSHLKF